MGDERLGVEVGLTPDEAQLRDLVGTDTLLRARSYADRGAVLKTQRSDGGARIFGQVAGTARIPYSSIAITGRRPDGTLESFHGTCTCPVGTNCKHAVALVLASAPQQQDEAPPSWERSLAGLLPRSALERTQPSIALQFELVLPTARRRGASRLTLRPVVPGKNGGWIRTGVSWSTVSYAGRHVEHDQRRVLGELLAVASSGGYVYGGYTMELASIRSRAIWDLLDEACALGLPLVEAGKAARSVILHREPARVVTDARRERGAIVLRTALAVGDERPDASAMLLIGERAHGVAWWQPDGTGLQLARLAAPLDAPVRGLVRRGPVRIPRRDEARFLADYYPLLRRRLSIESGDGSVVLPEAAPPMLRLAVEHLPEHRARIRWAWRYATGDEPLWPDGAPGQLRDIDHESSVLARINELARPVPALFHTGPDGRRRIAPECTLGGIDTVRFTAELLPRLVGVSDLAVDEVGTPAAYREAAAAPVVALTGGASDGRDWFDLAVTVSVEGEDVPFEQLFVALATGAGQVILPSGTYFSTDREELRQLAELIAEARAVHDSPPATIRLSRFQASLWDELDRLAVLGGQAAAWQQSVRGLGDGAAMAEVPVPAGLHATLRPYQQIGLNWLAFLYANGLGGVLADEMGLGKTIQTLALICHLKERSPAVAPFLVVAPTSVVLNWAAECRRFAPGLTVRTITETARRRRSDLAAEVAGADVVVTSYTLFRLEHDAYAAVDWAGLVLDEAQFAKNHQSHNYRCARKLAAPFKLAITGTPMENNLAELWSIVSIAAPGLFATLDRFEEHFRRPIERGGDADRLATLRRRVRPLMLRRTKAAVESDLPAKQEQVIELALNPRHRRVYDTYLHRERQKVLGLLDDLDANRFQIFRSLTLLRQASLAAGLVDPAHAGVPSTKLDALVDLLTEIVQEGHRTLVFSQFTRYLDSARNRLDAEGIDYCYLDGRTRNRASVVAEFKTGTAPVFLISLKAGGFGLNLAEADYCVLLDPWWNPATEAQAVDRVHRIGQTRKVIVYRLVAKDTIEEKVMALQASKAALFGSVLADGAFSSGRLCADDIRGMLG